MAEAAPDLSEFVKLSKPQNKPCMVRFALENLKPKEREQLQAALDTDNGIITTAAVAKWLKSRGVDITPQAVGSHRRETCRCAKE